MLLVAEVEDRQFLKGMNEYMNVWKEERRWSIAIGDVNT